MADTKLATDLYIKAEHFKAIYSHAEINKVVLFPSGKRLRIRQGLRDWYLTDENQTQIGQLCNSAMELEGLIDSLSHQEGFKS